MIEDKLTSYPDKLAARLNTVRKLILEIAETSETVGCIEESLKWNQISFATVHPKSGTPIRIDGDMDADTCSVYVPCSTSLIEDFRTHHPDMFDYHGNREIRMSLNMPLPTTELTLFLTAALTYYLG